MIIAGDSRYGLLLPEIHAPNIGVGAPDARVHSCVCQKTCARSLRCPRRRVCVWDACVGGSPARVGDTRVEGTRACVEVRASPGLLWALAIHASGTVFERGWKRLYVCNPPIRKALKRDTDGLPFSLEENSEGVRR